MPRKTVYQLINLLNENNDDLIMQSKIKIFDRKYKAYIESH